MIYGIGVDTTTISRVEKSMRRTLFVQRVFGPQEQELLRRRAESAATAAANFAAKEAFGKALGTGICTAFALNEVQVLRSETKAPYLLLSGHAAALAQQHGLTAHVSLTHEGDFATAFVVLEQHTNAPHTPAHTQGAPAESAQTGRDTTV